jgi:hypothetical protein
VEVEVEGARKGQIFLQIKTMVPTAVLQAVTISRVRVLVPRVRLAQTMVLREQTAVAEVEAVEAGQVMQEMVLRVVQERNGIRRMVPAVAVAEGEDLTAAIVLQVLSAAPVLSMAVAVAAREAKTAVITIR